MVEVVTVESRPRRSFGGLFKIRSSKSEFGMDTSFATATTVFDDSCTVSRRSSGSSGHFTYPSNHSKGWARAMNYLRRRSPSTIIVDTEDFEEDIRNKNSSANRVHDFFAKELNRCEPNQLRLLREQREEGTRVVITEDDDDDDDKDTNSASNASAVAESEKSIDCESSSADIALQSRWQALDIQRRLLGAKHPDVQFLERQIRRRVVVTRAHNRCGDSFLLSPRHHRHQSAQSERANPYYPYNEPRFSPAFVPRPSDQ
ncbi:predicted protein [Phaeodactylum tricornutum CCAP 1055/1]|jgi:hypothetical protein|uniref:Uncharacterized protein n=2 Tax=Phaeodactylum tricornutum TaxID=2850 RepID=B7GAE7_PHATC|nr:predicted protein [Phaeodactylum tricornutum CCAP 1055/1]EEC44240.1 predicted protein [Phaeodactylum tricornutum CCAP 1055/1]|eukprot:XP_002184062.1 predicted protein [Phaeodactylum tricornutum CCAP 1055/1]